MESSIEHLSATFGESGQQLQSAMIGLTQLAHFTSRSGSTAGVATTAPTGESPLTWEELLGDREIPGPGSGSGTTPAGGLQIDVDNSNSWGNGACPSVTVTNTSSAPITWEIELNLGGTMTSMWNAQVVGQTGTNARIAGDSWNATLAPGDRAEFGYCVNY